ncbi:hypothetical protein IJ579_05945 [bacterium]|nr:hypothetical protein [bacterium]
MKRKSFLSKVLFTAGVLSITAIPAFAVNWVLIGDGHYIDSHSIKPSSSYGTYTMTTEYLAKNNVPLETINGRNIYSIRTESYIDCKTNFAKTISYTAYDAGKRAVVSSKNIGKQWMDINQPGSRAYESYAFVCTDRYLNSYHGYHPLWWY